jgi:hypothetical protein
MTQQFPPYIFGWLLKGNRASIEHQHMVTLLNNNAGSNNNLGTSK